MNLNGIAAKEDCGTRNGQIVILHKITEFYNVRNQLLTQGTLNQVLSEGIKSMEVTKDAKIRNRYNQVPHLTED